MVKPTHLCSSRAHWQVKGPSSGLDRSAQERFELETHANQLHCTLLVSNTKGPEINHQLGNSIPQHHLPVVAQMVRHFSSKEITKNQFGCSHWWWESWVSMWVRVRVQKKKKKIIRPDKCFDAEVRLSKRIQFYTVIPNPDASFLLAKETPSTHKWAVGFGTHLLNFITINFHFMYH